jgi:hypothetical protein
MRGSWVIWALGALACAGCSDNAQQTPNGVMTGAGSAAPAAASAGAGGGVAPSAGAAPGVPVANAGTGGTTATPAGAGGSAGAPAIMDAGLMTSDAAASGDAAAGADAAGDPGSGKCDRPCLIMHVHDFLDALVAHDGSKLPMATALKYTENGTAQMIGQGLWKSASKLHEDTRLEFADPDQGQVASQIVIDENGGTPVLYQARLKLVEHQITEIESMSVRQADAANGFFSVEGMKPEAIWNQPIDASKRLTRMQLKAEVDHYIDYLDGKTDSSGVHLDSGCARYENGIQTASGVGFALQNWAFDVVPRYLVFDEEYGIAWGMFPFAMTADSLVVGEAFKVVDGKIMMIRAVMANMPAKAWD